MLRAASATPQASTSPTVANAGSLFVLASAVWMRMAQVMARSELSDFVLHPFADKQTHLRRLGGTSASWQAPSNRGDSHRSPQQGSLANDHRPDYTRQIHIETSYHTIDSPPFFITFIPSYVFFFVNMERTCTPASPLK
jgi:hypothetical protein